MQASIWVSVIILINFSNLKSSVTDMNRLYNINNRVMGKFFLVFGALVIMMSCGKDVDQFIPRTSLEETGNVDRLMTKLQSDIAGDVTTTLSCRCSGGEAFEVDKDLVLVIPIGFVDLAKFPCINGFFEIKVTVCDTKGEILISGLPTISEGKLLESRIEMNIQIYDGTTPVKLAHGKQIQILVNDPDPRERMELFYGGDQEWIQADRNPATWDNVLNSEWFINIDSGQQIISGFGYECFSDSLDWINVDVFFEVPAEQRTTVCVDLPEEFTNTNTTVFMVFNDYNSILVMNGDAETMQFCEPYGAAPLGFNVTFVVLSEMGEDDYLFSTQSAVITPGLIEIINPKKTPYEEIEKYINTL